MKTSTPFKIRFRRFITDRYAYRDRPDYLSELAAFGVIVMAVIWPIFSLVMR